MDLQALVNSFRDTADDSAEPYLWGDTEVTRWFNEAEKEACLRARLLYDEDTAAICQISIDDGATPGVYATSFALDSRIIEVKRAWLVDANNVHTPLTIKDVAGMDLIDPYWRTYNTALYPYLITSTTGTVRLVGMPQQDYTLHLGVDRYPIYEMEVTVDEPEIQAIHHPFLLDWVLFRAYSKRDPDTYNPEKASLAEAQFVSKFGYRPNANVMRKHAERRKHVTRPIPF